jgi:hypothetical protein
MFRSVLKTALSAVALASLASAANAQVVSIQLQEAGFPTETISQGTLTAVFNGTYGTFSGTFGGIILPPQPFFDGEVDLTHAVGTLTVLVTATGLTDQLGAYPTLVFLNGLKVVGTPPGPGPVTIQDSTFVDPADVAFSMAHPLASATFSARGQSFQITPFGPLTAPYSLTEEFIITASGATDIQSIIQLSAVPEPSTWAMMLLGFAGLGFAFHRWQRQPSLA